MKNAYIIVCLKREINAYIPCNYMIYMACVVCLLFLFLRQMTVNIDPTQQRKE